MNVLVTGAAGFVGTHLSRELREHGHSVVGIDRRGLDDDTIIVHELRNGIALHTLGWADVVVHLAAKVGREFGEDDLLETVIENAAVTAKIAEQCGDLGVKLVYASTSEVYGDQADTSCREDGLLALPHNLYGLSKRWGEEACRLYAPEELLILRFSMPYGPGLPAGRGRAAIVNFLDQAQRRAQIPVHRGAERAWCWIGDTVRAVRTLLERDEEGTWNIGRDDNATPMVDVARIACDLTEAPHELIVEVDPPERQTIVKRLSTEKLRALGWQPEVELEEGMRRTLAAMNA